ncbi:hypothetical protein TBLA_0F00595 [Henningerozyma blattae CBS 6284]|uniref:Uncharacterized protein n=1 Tax=Henningerozyma blattae (strain ATCC 34711 / CBS 6284 / DSM 70876 / NBRC 10599 / NRRL Y-10934 / UCD 77-7) TaxID=1071380 RepID=I2H5F2_HENB6|nr:hypothetical protein TBLA_0F00595 [Tetrapisispora blattae CBS 6284]CCH61604.1 hypothetical protein TBLA_0F00595 [Tetrapisispora blattae CBS 6284]
MVRFQYEDQTRMFAKKNVKEPQRAGTSKANYVIPITMTIVVIAILAIMLIVRITKLKLSIKRREGRRRVALQRAIHRSNRRRGGDTLPNSSSRTQDDGLDIVPEYTAVTSPKDYGHFDINGKFHYNLTSKSVMKDLDISVHSVDFSKDEQISAPMRTTTREPPSERIPLSSYLENLELQPVSSFQSSTEEETLPDYCSNSTQLNIST